MEKQDESKLIQLLKEGDEVAFNIIYDQHKQDLERFMKQQGIGKEDIEDILQEVFASLWDKRKEREITSNLKGYLMRAVCYKRINLFRKNQNTTKRYMIYEQSQAVNTVDSPTNQELFESLTQKINLMAPEMEREVFKGTWENGEKPKEIAAKLNIEPYQVRRILSQLCTRLKILIKKQQ